MLPTPCDDTGKESSVPACTAMYMAPMLTKVHEAAQSHGCMLWHARVSDEVTTEGDLTKSVASGNLRTAHELVGTSTTPELVTAYTNGAMQASGQKDVMVARGTLLPNLMLRCHLGIQQRNTM